MHCKYCGTALSKNSPICPKCKRLMTAEQLEMRKEMNGVNNPFVQRLEKLAYEKEKYKLENNGDHISIKPYAIILLILLAIVLIAWFF